MIVYNEGNGSSPVEQTKRRKIMTRLMIGFTSMLVLAVVLTAATARFNAPQFGPAQFCDGEQIQSVLVTDRKRFAGHCQFGLTTTPVGELAFAFFLTLPASFDALSLAVFDIVTIQDNGVTTVFTSPLVGTIRISKPFQTSTQPLVTSFKRVRIERDASVIWFVFQDGDADWADNYMRSLQEFTN